MWLSISIVLLFRSCDFGLVLLEVTDFYLLSWFVLRDSSGYMESVLR